MDDDTYQAFVAYMNEEIREQKRAASKRRR